MTRRRALIRYRIAISLALISAGFGVLSVLSADATKRLSALVETDPAKQLKTRSDQSTELPKSRLQEVTSQLPLAFEANEGQAGSQVRFLSRSAGYDLLLTTGEAVVKSSRSSLHLKFVGANPRSEP